MAKHFHWSVYLAMMPLALAGIVGAGFVVDSILSLIAAPAHADCLQWGRDRQNNRLCMLDDLVLRNPIIAEQPSRVLPPGGAPTVTHQTVKCREGYQVVLLGIGQPVCARDIIEAE